MALRIQWLFAAGALFIATFVAGVAGAAEPAEADTSAARPQSKYQPPPGYRTRRRGDKLVYCKKVAIPESRLMAEKCYDQMQLREIEFQMEQQRQEIDQRRRIRPIAHDLRLESVFLCHVIDNVQ